jgi:hypothetical protein
MSGGKASTCQQGVRYPVVVTTAARARDLRQRPGVHPKSKLPISLKGRNGAEGIRTPAQAAISKGFLEPEFEPRGSNSWAPFPKERALGNAYRALAEPRGLGRSPRGPGVGAESVASTS